MANLDKVPTRLEVLGAIINGENPDLKFGFHSKSSGWHVCVMCGYRTEATNIHRSCPMLPIDPDRPERRSLRGRRMAINMIPSLEKGYRPPETVWGYDDEKEWEWNTNPEEWIETLREHLTNSPQQEIYTS